MPDALDRVLLLGDRAALRADSSQPLSKCPKCRFTSQDYFDLDVERVFARSWVAVGYAPCIPNPGDVQPLSIFGFPMVTLRDGDGIVHVFHNIGAHDGCPW